MASSSTGGDKSAKRTSSNVATGSVWESRMRIDQVRGGIKVFSGGVENLDVDDIKTENRASEQTNRNSNGFGLAEKRRACKSESNSIQIVGNRSPSQLQRKKTRVSSFSNGEGGCKSSAQFRRKKSASDNDDQRSTILISKSRSDLKLSNNRDSLEANGLDRSVRVADDRNSAEEKHSGEDTGGSDDEIEKGPIQLETEKTRSDEQNTYDEDECVKGSGDDSINGFASGEDEIEEAEEMIDEKNVSLDEEIVVEKSISTCDCIQINATQISHSNSNSSLKYKFSSKPTIAIANAKSSSRIEFSPARKPPPKFTRPTISFPIRDSGGNQRVPHTHSKLQSIVDLVMWKHVPRSSLVFGSGTFLIISSSYTRDLDISFISVTSYLGLIYLAIIFLYKSFKSRYIMEGNVMNCCHGLVVIGEEEAIWVLRLILPYVNEFLLKLKALFSGDPAVTMKLAVALYALARCGNSITIWKMVKLGFLAAFILPKFCSSYSPQITGYGKFWILRFQDAWRSCSHKKVVGFAIFTIVWNLSSVVARIWAAFMLLVAVRYYQQSRIKAERLDEDGVEKGRSFNANRGLQRPQVISKPRQGRHNATSMSGTHVDIKGAKKCS